MKAEDFDKRIRQRMEELNPVFNERDWNRLNRKMQDHPANRSRAGLWLLLLLLVGSGVGLGYRWYDQKDADRFPAPQIRPVVPQAAVTFEATKAGGIQNHENPMGGAGNSNSSQAGSGDRGFASTPTGFHRTAVPMKSSSSRLIPLQEPTGSGSESPRNTASPVHFSRLSGEGQIHQDGNLRETMATLRTPPGDASGFVDETSIPRVGEGFFVAGLVTLPGMVVSSATPRMLTKAKLKPGFRPSKWLAGAVTAATAKHLNTGVGFEIKTNKNIAFGSGLLRQDYFDQRFSDQLAFSNSTEGDLGDLIRPRHSKSLDITDITIKSVDWVMPLQLKYYRPFSTKYAAFASAGLQLTLKSKTTLDFDFVNYDTQLEMSESDFDQPSNRSTLINHFTCALGVQREFRYLSMQLSGFLQKNNSNQPHIQKYEPGLQFGLYYRL